MRCVVSRDDGAMQRGDSGIRNRVENRFENCFWRGAVESLRCQIRGCRGQERQEKKCFRFVYSPPPGPSFHSAVKYVTCQMPSGLPLPVSRRMAEVRWFFADPKRGPHWLPIRWPKFAILKDKDTRKFRR